MSTVSERLNESLAEAGVREVEREGEFARELPNDFRFAYEQLRRYGLAFAERYRLVFDTTSAVAGLPGVKTALCYIPTIGYTLYYLTEANDLIVRLKSFEKFHDELLPRIDVLKQFETSAMSEASAQIVPCPPEASPETRAAALAAAAPRIQAVRLARRDALEELTSIADDLDRFLSDVSALVSFFEAVHGAYVLFVRVTRPLVRVVEPVAVRAGISVNTAFRALLIAIVVQWIVPWPLGIAEVAGIEGWLAWAMWPLDVALLAAVLYMGMRAIARLLGSKPATNAAAEPEEPENEVLSDAAADKLLADEVFHRFDADGSGAIESNELRQLLEACKMPSTDSDVKRTMRAIDKDGNGSIDFDEFWAWWASNQRSGGARTQQAAPATGKPSSVGDASSEIAVTPHEQFLLLRQQLHRQVVDWVEVLNRVDEKGQAQPNASKGESASASAGGASKGASKTTSQRPRSFPKFFARAAARLIHGPRSAAALERAKLRTELTNLQESAARLSQTATLLRCYAARIRTLRYAVAGVAGMLRYRTLGATGATAAKLIEAWPTDDDTLPRRRTGEKGEKGTSTTTATAAAGSSTKSS